MGQRMMILSFKVSEAMMEHVRRLIVDQSKPLHERAGHREKKQVKPKVSVPFPVISEEEMVKKLFLMSLNSEIRDLRQRELWDEHVKQTRAQFGDGRRPNGSVKTGTPPPEEAEGIDAEIAQELLFDESEKEAGNQLVKHLNQEIKETLEAGAARVKR